MNKFNLKEDRTRQTTIQLLKYGVIGISNTLITLVTFYLLNTWLGAPYGVANVVGYVLGIINSFVWNRSWVFDAKGKGNVWRQGALFLGGFAVCWLLQALTGWILLEPIGMKNLAEDVIPFLPMKNPGQNIVMVISMVVYTIANYVWNRAVTFKEIRNKC